MLRNCVDVSVKIFMKLSDNSCYSVPLTFTLYENIASVFFNKEFINSQFYVPVWKKHHTCKAMTSLQRSHAGFDNENKRIAYFSPQARDGPGSARTAAEHCN